MEFQPKALDLRAFCQRLVDEALSAAECRNPIHVDCPEFDGSALGDERLLRHILLNIITNALKYSECGDPIRVTIRREGCEAVWGISDKGIGIPETDREWLFNAFHRGRNVGQRPGSGLGLVIVKRCLDLHGGRIHIDSKVGEGTTVILRVPVFAASS
jgi:signal transduction histidine kinase